SAATLALRCMDGVFLSPNEDEFVGRIAEELEQFMQQGQHHRVLLFPPLSSRLRYLIHRTVDNVDLLSSFSVGEGWRRRTVICHSAVRLPSETNDQKPSNNPPRPHRPPQPWGRGGRGGRLRHGGEVHGDNTRACVGSGRIKRPPWKKPDKALYVPKAMRKKAEWGEQESPLVAVTESGGDVAREEEICPKASAGDAQEELGQTEGSPGNVPMALGKQQEPGEECVSGKSNAGGNDECPPCCMDVPSSENRNDFSGQESQDKDCSGSLSSLDNKNPTEAEEQDQSCNTAMPEGSKIPCQLQAEDQTSRDAGVKERSGLADALWRELHLSAGDKEESAAVRGQSGLEDDCTAELLAEIVGYLTVKDISIEKISIDYSSYGEAQLGEGDFGHVTEIYDFSPSLKTENLLEALADFHESGFKIQWVDDTHALGIFSSPSAASQALGRRYPSLKIRPLIHATKQSKIKALQRPKLLHLAKERPQTDTAVAKRLVTRALGLKHKQQDGSGTEALLPENLDQEE
ncbi:R3HC1 protein, partial [Chroicocephalus maculipennis]|nr:R3HC1 protein [Chroicocephalus maculipennis]